MYDSVSIIITLIIAFFGLFFINSFLKRFFPKFREIYTFKSANFFCKILIFICLGVGFFAYLLPFSGLNNLMNGLYYHYLDDEPISYSSPRDLQECTLQYAKKLETKWITITDYAKCKKLHEIFFSDKRRENKCTKVILENDDIKIEDCSKRVFFSRNIYFFDHFVLYKWSLILFGIFAVLSLIIALLKIRKKA